MDSNTTRPDPELLLRYVRNQVTDAERQTVLELLSQDDQLRVIVDDIHRAERLTEDIIRLEAIDMEAGYGHVKSKIRTHRLDRLRHAAMRCAAILMLPLVVCSIVMSYFYLKERTSEVHFAEVSTPAGTVIRYELPDGSVVWLNAGSKLRYPVRFTDRKREVELHGEAYFEVEADPEKPFYVNTDAGMSVYVYGTAFNVNAYDDEACIETSLERGHVNVIAGEKSMNIEPGQQATFDRATGRLSLASVRVEDESAWRDGCLVFRSTPLDEILRRLSRRFNVDIEFRNHAGSAPAYRATFRDENLDQIFDYLSASGSIRWRVISPERRDGEQLIKRRILVEQY